MYKLLAFILVALPAATSAQASVHSLNPFQDITQLDTDGNALYSAVGIDGNSIILATHTATGTRTTLLRQVPGGRWEVSRVLSEVALPDNEIAADIAMKNGIAAVRISTRRILIFERVNNNWTQTDALDSLDYTGGLAISGARILLGAVGCTQGADGFVFEKNATTGRWVVTGRIDQGSTQCDVSGDLDLNNTTAMIKLPLSRDVQVFRRNGSALDWIQSAAFQLPADQFGSISTVGAMAVQGTVAVAPGASYFRVDANGNWAYTGRVTPLDYATGTGGGGHPVFRDGILISTDGHQDSIRTQFRLYAYAPNASGGFDHAAILKTFFSPADYDVSGRTVVVTSVDKVTLDDDIPPPDSFAPEANVTSEDSYPYKPSTQIFSLPAPLVGDDAIAQDFETRDVSGFTQAGNAGFSLVGAGSGFVFRSAAGGDAIAVLNGSNWRGYEHVEADVTPVAIASGDPWLGLALRYTDANNYYVASIRGSNRLQIDMKLGGNLIPINGMTFPFRLNAARHLAFTVEGRTLTAVVTSPEGRAELTADNGQFGGGSAALLTSRARVDFDNVLARPTAQIAFADTQHDTARITRPWKFTRGGWENTAQSGLRQTDAYTSDTSAVTGVPVRNQDVSATLRLDSSDAASSVTSFGVLARYVDARNYYSLSVRRSGTIQIRKAVSGVVTVLKSASFTAGTGFRQYGLRVIGDELHAYVDGRLVFAVHDGDIASGTYGLATNRSAITSAHFQASQP